MKLIKLTDFYDGVSPEYVNAEEVCHFQKFSEQQYEAVTTKKKTAWGTKTVVDYNPTELKTGSVVFTKLQGHHTVVKESPEQIYQLIQGATNG